MTIGEYLDFRQRHTQLLQLRTGTLDQLAGGFHRRHPAGHAAGHQLGQRMAIVEIQRRPADEGQLALGHQLHRAHVVGFNQQFAVVTQATQAGQLGSRLHQGQAGQDQLRRRGFREIAGQAEPVVKHQRTALGTHRFTEVDHIQRLLCHVCVEIQRLLAIPVEQHRAEREFHAWLLVHCQARW